MITRILEIDSATVLFGLVYKIKIPGVTLVMLKIRSFDAKNLDARI